MKAKVKETQQIVNVHCVCPDVNVSVLAWEDENRERYLFRELDTEDLTDYKSWTENLIHDLAIKAFSEDVTEENRREVVNNIVLYAYAVVDAMMKEAKTWR